MIYPDEPWTREPPIWALLESDSSAVAIAHNGLSVYPVVSGSDPIAAAIDDPCCEVKVGGRVYAWSATSLSGRLTARVLKGNGNGEAIRC